MRPVEQSVLTVLTVIQLASFVLSNSGVHSEEHRCKQGWHSIHDSCYMLALESEEFNEVKAPYNEAQDVVCRALSGTLVLAMVCDRSDKRCNQHQLQLENLLLEKLDLDSALLVGIQMQPKVNGLVYFWDKLSLQESMRPSDLKSRRALITPSMFVNKSLPQEALKQNQLCLTVKRTENDQLRYHPVNCSEPQLVMCRSAKAYLPPLLVLSELIWLLGLLFAISGFVFRMHKSAMLAN